jgi:glutamate dehydrogenase/leucine dehydrogenase
VLASQLADWGGESLIVRRDRDSGAWILVAIHSTLLGPAAGGTRMKPYPDLDAALEDALRLSAGMTYKFATPGLPFGGAKAVIMVPPDLEPVARNDLLRRFGTVVRQLDGEFFTGPDVGTSSDDMDVIAATGAPYVFSRTPDAGGAGDPGPFTALGVFTGIATSCEVVFGGTGVRGRRVLVQGAGDVGGGLIELLTEAGAEVLFSEVDDDLITKFRDRGLEHVPPAAVFTTECDVFAPCALGGVLSEDTVAQMRCRVIGGSANNQLATPGDASGITSRGILYAPDYVINVGGAMAIPGIEALGWTPQDAADKIERYVRETLLRIFATATNQGITTDEAARRMAEENLAAAGR